QSLRLGCRTSRARANRRTRRSGAQAMMPKLRSPGITTAEAMMRILIVATLTLSLPLACLYQQARSAG
ncbi:MAG TPA: hypothetical protein VKA97_00960, partial [Pyrinomonadaceae bacterium]|nr:hypothetical protein [Pyrinomonadaceae bacterium]